MCDIVYGWPLRHTFNCDTINSLNFIDGSFSAALHSESLIHLSYLQGFFFSFSSTSTWAISNCTWLFCAWYRNKLCISTQDSITIYFSWLLYISGRIQDHVYLNLYVFIWHFKTLTQIYIYQSKGMTRNIHDLPNWKIKQCDATIRK